MSIESISESTFNLISRFSNLNIGGKQVCAPYYMNLKGQRGGLRVMVGKGDPEEIEHEVYVWAQVRGFDLNKASVDQIREFMIKEGIGIDCSGFAVYVVNNELRVHGYKEIWNYLKFPSNTLMARLRRKLRPVENVGANTMTSDANCIRIENYNDIKPLDLIRAKGKQRNAHHVGIITKVVRDDHGNTVEFEYVNSHRFYEDQNGIRFGTVKIIKPQENLLAQEWDDEYEGRNYFYEDLEVEFEDNGVRRLKILEGR